MHCTWLCAEEEISQTWILDIAASFDNCKAWKFIPQWVWSGPRLFELVWNLLLAFLCLLQRFKTGQIDEFSCLGIVHSMTRVSLHPRYNKLPSLKNLYPFATCRPIQTADRLKTASDASTDMGRLVQKIIPLKYLQKARHPLLLLFFFVPLLEPRGNRL